MFISWQFRDVNNLMLLYAPPPGFDAKTFYNHQLLSKFDIFLNCWYLLCMVNNLVYFWRILIDIQAVENNPCKLSVVVNFGVVR